MSGVAADGSILFLTFGVLLFFTMPNAGKFLGAGAIAIGILLVFISSRRSVDYHRAFKCLIGVAVGEAHPMIRSLLGLRGRIGIIIRSG
ncbi:hypothetical protein [Dactylococcopsis salina]|uniref:hypothetical protein n=1 Tax=Dactylococcopsis salina TaxID=292566 RepID=UPI0003137AE2|nr:hypothetical protein [Dactylococcopsis salina]